MRNILLLPTIFISLMFGIVTANAISHCDPGEVIIKFSHVTNAEHHPKGLAASRLADLVNAELNGKACMLVYPNSELFDDREVLEALLHGDVQLAAPSLSKFEKFTKKFRVFDLPFFFPNIQAVDKFQNSPAGSALKDAMLDYGVKGLAFWHNGMKQLSASRTLRKPSDAKGLKFRIQTSEVLAEQFLAIDAIPQKMPLNEVYDALKNGVIDGQENTWSNIYGRKFYKVQNSIVETDHGIIDYLLVTSDTWWEGLNPSLRKEIKRLIDQVTIERNAISEKINLENRNNIILDYGKIIVLNKSEKEKWLLSLKPVWKQFKKDIGPALFNEALRHSQARNQSLK